MSAQQAAETYQNALLSLTHVLKRPMFMIQGALSNIRDQASHVVPADLLEDIEDALLSVQHTEVVCSGISRVFAFEAGRTEWERPEAIDAKSEFQGLAGALRRSLGRQDLSFSVLGEDVELMMVRDSFLYVFYSLIDNAVKYSDRGGHIVIDCGREGSTYRIKVRSKGLEIKDHDSVFRKFARGEDAYRMNETGLGLGCWAAREHMRQMGGDILLETDGPVSTFIVEFPPGSVTVNREGEPVEDTLVGQ